MLTKEEFSRLLSTGPLLLDGATGSKLQKAGMPKGCCTEQWILDNPIPLMDLQRRYAQAGSHIIYAPTFQAQPIALARVGLDKETESINEKLVCLSRAAAPDCLIAGDLTTLAVYTDSWDEANFDLLVENYRRQIHGLLQGGVDLLIGETLLYPQEAEAILTAAELEGASCCMYSFTMQSDGSLFSGRDVGPVLQELERGDAAAVEQPIQQRPTAPSYHSHDGGDNYRSAQHRKVIRTLGDSAVDGDEIDQCNEHIAAQRAYCCALDADGRVCHQRAVGHDLQHAAAQQRQHRHILLAIGLQHAAGHDGQTHEHTGDAQHRQVIGRSCSCFRHSGI